MADRVELVLSQLLVPDNAVIQQATQDLKQLIKDPNIVPALCSVLASSQNPQVRQYAAVLLRRRTLKRRQWQCLVPSVRDSITTNLLQVLLQEPEKSVRKSLAQLVASIAKHELPEGRWPQLLQFLQEYTRSQSPQQRELGMYVMSTLAGVAAEQLKPHFQSLLELCAATLNDEQNPKVPFYTVLTLTHLVPFIGTDEVKPFQQLLPKVVEVIKTAVSRDEEEACEAMEIFDELLECEVAVISPHVRAIMEFSMELGSNRNLGSSIRVKALSFSSNLVRLKRKTVLKLKLTQPLLAVLFPIICEPQEEEEEEDFDEAESSSANSYACQVVDVMALNIAPDKIIPPLMGHVKEGLQSEDPHHRRAAYMTIAVASEGCADYIRNKLLRDLLQCVYQGLQDSSLMVRNAAMFALGQFSEYLQPYISKFSSELLPILFECLGKASQNIESDPRGSTKTFYALEMFCENLGKDILPYLDNLMQYLLGTLANSNSPRAKELAISAIGATANAAEKSMVTYMPQILELLKSYLVPTTEEGLLKVQIQTLDTLGVLARTLGEEFGALSTQCMELGLQLLSDATDPDLRRCIYGLFAALSTLLKEQMTPHLPVMVKQMIDSIKSAEGITAHYSEAETQMFKVFEDEEEELEGDDDDEDDCVQGFSVENAYLDEKEDACSALGEISMNTGVGFMAYLEQCYKEVWDMLEYPATDIRKTAVTATGAFCCAVGAVAKESNSLDSQTALFAMLTKTLPKFLQMIHEDNERQVAMTTLESITEMLEKIGEPIIQCAGSVDKIITAVKDVLQEKVACQDVTEEVEETGETEQAEFDSILMENAGDVIPALAKVVGGEAFKPYFAGMLPDLLKRMKAGRPDSERSFSVGTLAETLEAMGPASAQFAPHLYPVISQMLSDEEDEVRSNAVYGLGVISQQGVATMYPHYPAVLKQLFDLLNKESNGRSRDNICAAVCRMIQVRPDSEHIPLAQVIPVLTQCLPLKEDFEEYDTVFNCLSLLYSNNNEEVVKQLPRILQVIAEILGTDKVKTKLEPVLVNMVQTSSQRHPQCLQAASENLAPELVTKLQTCLSLPASP